MKSAERFRSFQLTVLWVFICTYITNGQDCLDVSVPTNMVICEPQDIDLDGIINGDFLEFEWNGTNGFFDDQNLITSDFVDATTTFTLEALNIGDVNLVTNGDFESGNTGFTSAYNFNPNTNVGGLGQGAYNLDVVYPFNWSGFNCPSIDGSTMMVINAAVVPNVEVYCADVAIQPNTEYAFSIDILTINNPPPILQFSINGVLLGDVFNGGPQCDVNQFYQIWDSGFNTTATICLVNQSTAAGGNDFALDNVSFTEICKGESEFTVIFEEFEAEIIEPTEISCDNPFVTLSATSTPDFNQQYEWSTSDGTIQGPSNTPSIIALEMGTYNLTVTSENGCIEETSIEVVGNNIIPVFSIAGNTILDCDNPSIFLESDLLDPTLDFMWTLPSGDEVNSSFIEVTEPGLYSLVVVDPSNNCSHSDFVIVNEQVWDPLVTAIVDGEIDCSNNNVDVNFQIDVPFDNLAITSPDNTITNSTSLVFTANQPGVYDYTFNNGICNFNGSFEITESLSFNFEVTDDIDSLTCTNQEETLYASIVGDFSSITWFNNGMIVSEDTTLMVSSPGTYIVEVTDSLGCIGLDSVTVFEDVEVPIVQFEMDTITCLNPVAGFDIISTTADSILWVGANESSTSYNPTFNVGGDYMLILYNENGCNDTIDAFLPISEDFPEITSNILDVDCHNPTGAINISSNLESDFDWIGPDTFASSEDSITDGIPGLYFLTVTTEDGCILMDTFEISIDTIKPSFMVIIDSLTCTQPSVIPTVVSSGNEAITWMFPDNSISTEDTPTLNISGEYIVTALSTNGCETSILVNLDSYTEATGFNISHGALTCETESTFLIADNSDLDYSLSDGITEIDFLDSIEITSPGSYSVIGTNQFGCDSVITLEVDLIEIVPEFEVDHGLLVCDNTTTFIVVNNPNLTYSIYDGNINIDFSDSTEINGVGTYSITGTNEFGCDSTITLEIEISEILPEFEVEHGFLTCSTTNTSIIVSNPDLSYMLVDGAGEVPFADSIIVTDVGVYTIIGTNEYGCTEEVNIEIVEQIQFPDILLEAEELNCSVTLSLVDNLNFNFLDINYQWTGENFSSTDTVIEVGNEGWYFLEITNALGCSSVDSIFVTGNFNMPDIEIIGDDLLECHEENEVLMISSSVTNFESTWYLLDGSIANQNQVEINEEGEYVASVIDIDNGCTSFDTIIIQRAASPELEIGLLPPLCHDGFGVLNQVNISGGEGPYTVFLDGQNIGVNTDLGSIDITDFDMHHIEIEDANGCSADTFFTVESITALSLDLILQLTNGDSQLTAITSFDTNEISEILWSPNSSLSCIDCLSPIADPEETTDYTLMITTENGCIVEATIQVVVEQKEGILLPNVFSPNGDDINDHFTVYEQFESVSSVELFSVYDRWGNLIFKRENFEPGIETLGWDGHMDGDIVASGVYVYLVKVIYDSGNLETVTGSVTVID